jgi:beta-phosphoglucomutase-like phosphatase (HAD superfamily)
VNPLPTGQPALGAAEQLLARASCLLLDFDGPMCRLFANSSPRLIAGAMRAHLAGRGVEITDPAYADSDDPHWIIRAPIAPSAARELEEILADSEEQAAVSATGTRHADDFVRGMAGRGVRLAVTTNNAPAAVHAYLDRHGLGGYFEKRVYGRSAHDPQLMKPHPDCLQRALADLRVTAGECLMIGDSLADADAAVAAGIPFLGYAASPRKVPRLRAHHPHAVVVGMDRLIAAAGLPPPNG